MSEKDEKQITVGELIELLKNFPSSAAVISEGCDCYGKVSGAHYDANDKYLGPHVCIERLSDY